MTNFRKAHQELARLAQLAAKTRGHDLGVWTWGGMWVPGRSVRGRVTGSAKCLVCRLEAAIDTQPDAASIEIGGPAIVSDCERKGGL